ncbi:hypothetical protein CEXT_500071 [Caerostris extrusa]|uniref:Uncharacterized protein n=1 Tax=Caerostris extrusa TaxID=172846 RepID=A0AAV4Y8F7_CAEEX|nr:hypothetical protein CEXT_500071 [Caerostris extrusa]
MDENGSFMVFVKQVFSKMVLLWNNGIFENGSFWNNGLRFVKQVFSKMVLLWNNGLRFCKASIFENGFYFRKWNNGLRFVNSIFSKMVLLWNNLDKYFRFKSKYFRKWFFYGIMDFVFCKANFRKWYFRKWFFYGIMDFVL